MGMGLPVGGASVGDADGDGERASKRQRRDDGSLWPEEEWLKTHPESITINIVLPDYPDKPNWGCDGSTLQLEVPLTLLVGTVRDRIAARVGLPISKQKFTYNGRPLANSTTLAGLNFDEGDTISVAIKEKK